LGRTIRAEGDSPKGAKSAGGVIYKRSKTAYERFERLVYTGAWVLALVALHILAYCFFIGVAP
jgi:hypothetical protein